MTTAVPRQFVGYVRVSTKKQGESGLGLEAQLQAVIDFARQQGATLLSTHVEVESGKRADRPKLASALAQAKRAGATLVVAKLDRLARNVAFLSSLMESKVDFLACDNPTANRLTVHILAAVAEDEARRISERTKAGLAALKARGVKLGSARPGHWEGREKLRLDGLAKGRKVASRRIRENALNDVADIAPFIVELRQIGESLATIAQRLNAEGHRTRKNAEWQAVQVKRVLDRLGARKGKEERDQNPSKRTTI